MDINSINNNDIQKLLNYYYSNSSLKCSDIESYLTNNEDIAAFKAKVTAANIEIFQKNISTIIEECPSNIIIYLLELPLPNGFDSFIDNYFASNFHTNYEQKLELNSASDSVYDDHAELLGTESLDAEDC